MSALRFVMHDYRKLWVVAGALHTRRTQASLTRRHEITKEATLCHSEASCVRRQSPTAAGSPEYYLFQLLDLPFVSL